MKKLGAVREGVLRADRITWTGHVRDMVLFAISNGRSEVDRSCGKTYLTLMNARTRISSKGQVVIPKAIREALHLRAGEALDITREGRRIVLEPASPDIERISYDEFRRRMPPYKGPPVPVEEMTSAIDRLFRKWRG